MHKVIRRTGLLVGTVLCVVLAQPVQEAVAVSSPTVASAGCLVCEQTAYGHWFLATSCEEGPFCMKSADSHPGVEPNGCGDSHDGCDET